MAGKYRKEQGQDNRRRFTVYLDQALFDRVSALARSQRRSVSSMMEVIIAEALADDEKEQEDDDSDNKRARA